MIDFWAERAPPDLEAFHAIAEGAFAALPVEFRAMCGDVVLHTSELPEDEMLEELEIDDAYELTGLYEGVDLTSQSMSDPSPHASHVHLFRLPILVEWVERGDVTLRELVVHVLVHEIGHHFGLSDDAMHEIEDATDA